MQVFVRGHLTMIAAPVQCDVDGIPKGSHCVSVSPIKVRFGSFLISGYGRPVVPDGHGPDRLVDDHRAVVRREAAARRPRPPVARRACTNRVKRDSWELLDGGRL